MNAKKHTKPVRPLTAKELKTVVGGVDLGAPKAPEMKPFVRVKRIPKHARQLGG
jgi:hypothetical protein